MYYSLISSMKKSSVDADAQAFITAAAITNATQATAVNTLVTSLKSYGIWNKMKALYPMVGGTAASHKFNLKDPRDLNAAFRLTFSGGWTHSSNGALPNGTNGFADTFLIPQNSLSQYNAHLSYYSRTLTTLDNRNELGCSSNSINELPIMQLYLLRSNNFTSDMSDYSTTRIITANTDTRGFFQNSRTTASNHKVYKNGLLLATNSATTIQTTWPTSKMAIAAYFNSITYQRFSDKQCAFASIGDGLTDTESSNFYTAVQAYQTSLSRQV